MRFGLFVSSLVLSLAYAPCVFATSVSSHATPKDVKMVAECYVLKSIASQKPPSNVVRESKKATLERLDSPKKWERFLDMASLEFKDEYVARAERKFSASVIKGRLADHFNDCENAMAFRAVNSNSIYRDSPVKTKKQKKIEKALSALSWGEE